MFASSTATDMTTFGFELAVDANIASVLVANNGLSQLKAGYYGSTFGFLNLVTRPFGGFLADRLYARYGLQAKKYATLILGVLEGAMSIAFGAVSSRSLPRHRFAADNLRAVHPH